ncbi:MFS transporter [Falsiroseomonas stagni]|uniref:Major Facilitator Superfamily protein n=1 Tax=Falsiroseomonas stagni DSM 19981 TaxID=1123062 RepID=A0A1I3XYU6_9PROT|nr:MFS transporter [Falsiroseomonas stagni]SFK24748.1 Major Facilitator Superfamily protein [Falsiroseomonas stagni DSM 19981]
MRHQDARREAPAETDGFPGWLVVVGAFLVLMVGFGAIYSYAAFAEQIADSFGAPRGSVALVYALSGSTCFFVSALSGRLADRIGPRVPAMVGMGLVGLGLMVAATARSLAEVLAGYGLLIGIGTGFAYVPAMAAVQGWFSTHRGLASGIAASGIGVGTALVPAGADAMLAIGDWRGAFVAFGAVSVLVGGAGALLLRRPPGRGRGATTEALPPARPWATRRFALAYAGTLLVSIPATLPQALLVGTARDLGIAWHEAVSLLGLIGLGTIAGRFLLAALADGLGRRATFLGCCMGMAASMAVWALAEGMASLQVFALVFGALQGGFVALLPAFAADSFGNRALGGVIGLIYTGRGIALLLAPPLVAAAQAMLAGPLPILLVALPGLAGAALLAAVRAAPR